MLGTAQCWNFIKSKIRREWKIAFTAAVVIGLLVHMPMMLRDIPNHDGLDSMHFDQNMVTSGRWFYIAMDYRTVVTSLSWFGKCHAGRILGN